MIFRIFLLLMYVIFFTIACGTCGSDEEQIEMHIYSEDISDMVRSPDYICEGYMYCQDENTFCIEITKAGDCGDNVLEDGQLFCQEVEETNDICKKHLNGKCFIESWCTESFKEPYSCIVSKDGDCPFLFDGEMSCYLDETCAAPYNKED